MRQILCILLSEVSAKQAFCITLLNTLCNKITTLESVGSLQSLVAGKLGDKAELGHNSRLYVPYREQLKSTSVVHGKEKSLIDW